MEQQSGAAGAAQAARTVLPGEPFEPPASSQVPAPRNEAPAFAAGEPSAFAPAEPPLAPPAWNYEPMPAPDGAPLYQAAPAAHVEPQPVGGDFDTLHDFANLPVAPQFGAPAPATEPFQAFSSAAFPSPAAEAPAYVPAQHTAAFAPAQPPAAAYPPPVFAPAADALPPLPPLQEDEGLFAEPEKKNKKDRKPVDKRLLAGALVVVLAGGGYFGYTQLSKKSSTNSNAPIVPVTTPVAHYNFPSNVAGLKLQPSNAAFTKTVKAAASQWSAPLAKRMNVASFSAGSPAIAVMVFHPAHAQLAAQYASLVRFSARPDKGDVAVAPHVAQPGAAGGQMTCGGQSGPDVQSWCVWRGTSTIGVMVVEGSPKSQITEILTREMRAYAEH